MASVAGVLIWQEMHPPPPPPPQTVAEIKIPPNPPPPPPPPPHVPQPKVPPPPNPSPLHEVPPVPSPVPVPNAVPPPPPQPPLQPQPPQQVDKASLRAQMERELLACIQNYATGHYPRAAFMAGKSGRVEVTFRNVGGHWGDVSISGSSNVRSLDQAAREAVIRANCPQPPDALSGDTFRYRITINYQLLGG